MSRKLEELTQYLSELFNINEQVKNRIGTITSEAYQEGWSDGAKAAQKKTASAPLNRNVTTSIQDEVMAAICLEYDSVLRLLTPHLYAHQRTASANAFGEAVRPAVAKAISSAWDGGFKLGAEFERKACLGAIEFAANSLVRMTTVEHGGARIPIQTVLDRGLLKHRVRWEQWPNIMRHEYVQARLYCGKPCVQIVVNGEYKGTVCPDGVIVGVSSVPILSVMSLAYNVAHADAHEKLSPECVGEVRVPDSRIRLFLFIDSKGNEFELKNTEYGTVIVKGDVVLGKLYRGEGDARGCSVDSSGTFILKHTECALRMCEDYGALTRAVFAFCKWACDSGATPQFMIKRVNNIPEHYGVFVRNEGGRFQVLNIHDEHLVTIEPDNRGALIADYGKTLFVNSSVIDAAVRTIRSRFYGNMA